MEKEGQAERWLALKEWFIDKEIRYVLFDMDGTLIETMEHFLVHMHTYCEFLSQKSGIGETKLFDVFMKGIISLRDEFNVQPSVLEVPARVVAKMCGVEGSELDQQIDGLMEIYKTVPEIFPEAANQVRLIRDAGVDTALVTHAGEEWTWQKRLNFIGLFKDCVCTRTDKSKDLEAWLEAVNALKVQPRHAMIVGDSWTSDILPALEMGAGVVVWVRNGRPSKNDDRVIEIDNIADLTDALLMN